MTDPDQHAERLARLQSRKANSSDQRRAVIGKILATGLTSTTVFAITTALGWSATSAAEKSAAVGADSEQLVLDLSTGQLVKYVNGVAVSAQQVADPNQLIAQAQAPAAANATILSSSTPTLPANWNPTPSPKPSNSKPSSASSVETAAPTETVAPAQNPTIVVESPLNTPTQIVTIPVAVPEPSRVIGDIGGGSRGGGGGGGGGSSSGS